MSSPPQSTRLSLKHSLLADWLAMAVNPDFQRQPFHVVAAVPQQIATLRECPPNRPLMRWSGGAGCQGTEVIKEDLLHQSEISLGTQLINQATLMPPALGVGAPPIVDPTGVLWRIGQNTAKAGG